MQLPNLSNPLGEKNFENLFEKHPRFKNIFITTRVNTFFFPKKRVRQSGNAGKEEEEIIVLEVMLDKQHRFPPLSIVKRITIKKRGRRRKWFTFHGGSDKYFQSPR